jgi:phytoene dehydrogenase-like protein
MGSVWGYVEGGMGRVSFAIAEAALEAGAQLAAGVPVARIAPGEGVELESGELIRAAKVISNADPKRTLGMLEPGDERVPDAFRERLEGWQVRSPVVKVNLALRELPGFTAAANGFEHQRAMVAITAGVDGVQEAADACRRGEPRIGFAELYFQSAYDDSVTPPGRHAMSAFAQYAPYELAEGDWDTRRDEIGALVLDAIEAHAPNVRDCIEEMEILGPPDIEERIGLTGGNIFQGEVLPFQMWDRRLEWRTPVDGLYLCGAATHPGGSVIGLNGRGAALAALAEG